MVWAWPLWRAFPNSGRASARDTSTSSPIARHIKVSRPSSPAPSSSSRVLREDRLNVVVIGAGPAGVMAALRAAELGASTTLVTRGALGGMAATDGPVPVRSLAHAARLIGGVRQLTSYGITVGEPRLDYARLLNRVREIVGDVAERSTLRREIDRLGVVVHEHVGTVRFVGPHAIEAESGLRLEAERFTLCTGGTARRLSVPGAQWAAS